ncbi:transcription antiterminator [Bacillaceae bacterium Marseille-Q3522]|nr:transcription antiterminator [Bacillaceae bacterium Marseille-Q3522]
MLSIRQKKILHLLMQADKAISTEELSHTLEVTSRTIRTDIKSLSENLHNHGAVISLKRGKGYELIIKDYSSFRPFLQELTTENDLENAIPTEPSERIKYMLRRLLLSEKYIKIEDFANELFISESSVKNGMKEIRSILKKFNLGLESRPNYGLKITGDEAKLRYCIAEYVFDSDQQILPSEDIKNIEKLLIRRTKEASILLSDIGKNNLITHIAIACKRIQNNNYVSIPEKDFEKIKASNEFFVAKQIVEDLQQSFAVQFPESEIAYITIHLLGTKIMSYQPVKEENFLNIIDDDILALAKNLLLEAEKVLQLGIAHDKELIYGLCLHLKPAINRYKYDMNIRNPLLLEIKKNYPVAFDAAIVIGQRLKKERNISINEDEIGYLALHVGAALERKKAAGKAKKCLIVCATGVASAQLLYHKLHATFGDKLEIIGTTNLLNLDKYDLGALDFIISTIPIKQALTIPVIDVNTIIRDEDILKLENIIIKNIGSALQYLKPELTFFKQELKSREEVIAFLADKITNLMEIPGEFKTLVEEREKMAPTSYGNLVAFPHPIRPLSDHTFWSVCTLKKPIQWGDHPVQFICLLSVQKKYTKELQKMYQLLVKISGNATLVNQLIKVDSYEEFTKILLSLEG